MSTQRDPLHKRDIPGIESAPRFDWAGTPLKNLYFVESRLPDGPRKEGLEPVILTPGGFDPYRGEYSDALVKRLLEDVGVPVVYEGHYTHEGNDGYLDIEGTVQDLVTVLTHGENRPLVTGLCGGTVCLGGALHRLGQRDDHATSGALLIGPYLTGRLNSFGKGVFYTALNMRNSPDARHWKYAGHGYTPSNTRRGDAWFQASQYNADVNAIDMKARNTNAYPIPVSTLYFKIDILNREGRARLRRMFDADEIKERIPGMHRDLTRIPEADDLIAGWVERTLAARDSKSEQGAA